MATTYKVSSSAELTSALSKAAGGDTVLLSSGNYGSVNLSNMNYNSYVTLRSADANNEAVFSSLKVDNSSYIRLDDVHVSHPTNGVSGSRVVQILNSNHVDFINSEVNGLVDKTYEGHYGIYVKDSDSIALNNNNVHDVGNGILVFSTDNVTVKDNSVDYVFSDFYKFGGVHDVLIENNKGGGHLYPDADSHADFMQFQGEASDVVIRGNTYLAQTTERAQGIFLDDASYKNILIEENIIYSGKVNAIKVSAGSGITVRDNTVLSVPNLGHKAAAISVPAGSVVQNNITSSYSGGSSGSNIVAQWDDVKDVNHYNTLFKNADAGLGVTLEDLRPVSGSAAETKGAHDRLMELLDGTDHSSSGSSSSSTPDPVVVVSDPTPVVADPVVTAPTPVKTDPAPVVKTPAPSTSTSTDASTDSNGAALWLAGDHDITSKSDVISVKPTSDLNLSSGTIWLNFNSNDVSGTKGVISKDATGYTGGGNHFTSFIQDGSLNVRFQDGSSDQTLKVDGIKANTDYNLQVSFGNGSASAWLNGASIGTVASDTTWVNNNEYLQVGANGWASDSGSSSFKHVFDGTISDVTIVEGAKTPAQMSSFLTGLTGQTTAATPVSAETAPSNTSDAATGTSSSLSPIFSLLGDHEFTGKVGSVITVEHEDNMEVSQGTVAFSFEADSVSKLAGLVSKDAHSYDGEGNHLSIYIDHGTLYARFQDSDSDATLSVGGIKAHTEYDVAASFDDDEVSLYLNGKLVGHDDFTMDWTHNDQFLQVGGLGWASADGAADASNAFDGTISDLAIYDHALNSADGNFFA